MLMILTITIFYLLLFMYFLNKTLRYKVYNYMTNIFIII